MKTTSFYLVVSLFLMNLSIICNQTAANDIPANILSPDLSLNDSLKSDSLLFQIQQKIFNAFVTSKITQSDNELVLLEQSLFSLNQKNPNSLIIYWYSYACYYHSIFWMIEKNNKYSEKILEEGIDQLEMVNQKTSEHLALLALMESFSIQFSPGIEAPFISKRVKQNAENALQLDSLNLRAWFVLGSNDFYTPTQYGGGKKAEGYLKKALSLKNQTVSNPCLPSWGKNTAYELLIRFYLNHNQFGEAKICYKEAISMFPDDYMIKKLEADVKDH